MAALAEAISAERVQLSHHTEDRIADTLGVALQFREVDLLDAAVPVDLVGCLLRDDAEPRLHTGKRRLYVEVLLRAVLVRPHAAHRVQLCQVLNLDAFERAHCILDILVYVLSSLQLWAEFLKNEIGGVGRDLSFG